MCEQAFAFLDGLAVFTLIAFVIAIVMILWPFLRD